MQKTITSSWIFSPQAFIEFIAGSEAQCFYRSMYVYIASACLDLLASEKTKSFLSISLIYLSQLRAKMTLMVLLFEGDSELERYLLAE